MRPFSEELKKNAKSISEQMNKQGMRVLAVAQKSYLDKECDFSVKDENDMVLIGIWLSSILPNRRLPVPSGSCMSTV